MIKVSVPRLASFFCISLLFVLNASSQAPVITSFSPVSAPVGATITLNGSGFDATPSNNIVYFGAAKAIVTASTPTSISCTVPLGANYKPLTVTVNNLTAYSNLSFNTTFSGTGVLNANTFSSFTQYSLSAAPLGIQACDIDLDGKPDLLYTTPIPGGTFSVRRNTSAGGVVSFAAAQVFTAAFGANSIATADFDGDGLPDVAVSNAYFNNASVLKNTSTPGNISFGPATDFMCDFDPTSISACDVDGDGKPDMVTGNSAPHTFSVYRNNSTGGTISFETSLEFSTGAEAKSIAFGDLDNDGKSDIITTAYNFYISTFKNTSTPGVISFGTRLDHATNFGPSACAVGDIDLDGLLDIAITSASHMSVFRNTSVVGVISLATRIDYSSNTPQSIVIADLTGEGKPDLITNSTSQMGIYKNLSTPGIIALETRINYPLGTAPTRLVSCDWDGDGISDMAATRTSSVIVMKNKINEPYITSYSPSFGNSGTVITINGTNFTGTTSVTIGGQSAASFTVVSPTRIDATVGVATAGSITVTSPIGTYTVTGFTLPPPMISSISPLSDTVGATITISGNNFATTAQNNIVYFGSVKAPVLSATANTVTVLVPAGTKYAPISLTTRNLTAFSKKPFNTIFTGDGLITTTTFSPKKDFATGVQPRNAAVADIDGDGRPDIAVSNYSSNNISVYRNTSVPRSISLAPKMDFSVTGNVPCVALADLDGDGRPDMITVSNASMMSVFRNTSTPGNISFAAKTDYTGLAYINDIIVDDFNNDGKPDIALANGASHVINIFKNNSWLPNQISLTSNPSVQNAGSVGWFSSGDLDNDNRQDIITSEFNGTFPEIVRNSTNPGDWSCNLVVAGILLGSFGAGGQVLADLDNDNRLDLAFIYRSLSAVRVFRNTSISGISVAPWVDWPTISGSEGIACNDFNGDGLFDVVNISEYASNSYAVLKNTSSTGSISFAPRVEFPLGTVLHSVTTADIDMDGKPDLLFTNGVTNLLHIVRNKYNEPYNLQLCPPIANSSLTSNLTGTTYQWQEDNGTGFTNIFNSSNYSGTQTVTLQLNAIPSTWTGYRYRCVVDGNNSELFQLSFVNTWTGSTNSNWENPANWSCGTIPDQNTDVIITSGTVVVNANTTIRTLTLLPGVNFSVAPGITLTILF